MTRNYFQIAERVAKRRGYKTETLQLETYQDSTLHGEPLNGMILRTELTGKAGLVCTSAPVAKSFTHSRRFIQRLRDIPSIETTLTYHAAILEIAEYSLIDDVQVRVARYSKEDIRNANFPKSTDCVIFFDVSLGNKPSQQVGNLLTTGENFVYCVRKFDDVIEKNARRTIRDLEKFIRKL